MPLTKLRADSGECKVGQNAVSRVGQVDTVGESEPPRIAGSALSQLDRQVKKHIAVLPGNCSHLRPSGWREHCVIESPNPTIVNAGFIVIPAQSGRSVSVRHRQPGARAAAKRAKAGDTPATLGVPHRGVFQVKSAATSGSAEPVQGERVLVGLEAVVVCGGD